MNKPSDSETSNAATDVRNDLLEHLVGYALSRTSGSFLADFRRAMEGTSMRPATFAMLATIEENPGINQTSLGRALGIQRANLVPLVNELLERVLIERQPAANDKRAFALVLSDAGRDMLATCTARINAHEERMLARLSAAERTQLLDLLARINRE